MEQHLHVVTKVSGLASALQERTMRYALQVTSLSRTLPDTWEGRHVADQLFRCATGVASNYRAACRARSHREFAAKLGIVLEEADENVFWLIFISRSGLCRAEELSTLLQEARELLAIFAASVKTARTRERSSAPR